MKNNVLLISGFFFLAIHLFFTFQEKYYLALAPLALLMLYAAFFYIDRLFLLIVFCTPLSLNLEDLGIGGVGVYLPTEPLLVGLMILYFFKTANRRQEKDNRVFQHPVTMLIIFHLSWILITSFVSELPVVSIKFFISRLWFVIPMYFFAIRYFKTGISKMYNFLWAYLLPLCFVLIVTVLKHSAQGFSEETGHWIMWPFFKDHTSYGAIIAFFIPALVIMSFDKTRTQRVRWLIMFMLLVFLVALFYSYTRAAWLSVFVALAVYLLFYFRVKFKYLLSVFAVVGTFVVANFTELSYMLQKNDAEHTTENFSERIESMSNVTSDASNLERLNRWNCAFRIFSRHPFFGCGPGTYSFLYAPYQDPADLTIISTNFGNGGNAHSEYLGPLAEQGALGCLLLLVLIGLVFYRGSKLYLQLEDPSSRKVVMICLLGLVTYFTHGVLNNYLDTDKASIPVWGAIAILVTMDIYKSELNKDKA